MRLTILFLAICVVVISTTYAGSHGKNKKQFKKGVEGHSAEAKDRYQKNEKSQKIKSEYKKSDKKRDLTSKSTNNKERPERKTRDVLETNKENPNEKIVEPQSTAGADLKQEQKEKRSKYDRKQEKTDIKKNNAPKESVGKHEATKETEKRVKRAKAKSEDQVIETIVNDNFKSEVNSGRSENNHKSSPRSKRTIDKTESKDKQHKTCNGVKSRKVSNPDIENSENPPLEQNEEEIIDEQPGISKSKVSEDLQQCEDSL